MLRQSGLSTGAQARGHDDSDWPWCITERPGGPAFEGRAAMRATPRPWGGLAVQAARMCCALPSVWQQHSSSF